MKEPAALQRGHVVQVALAHGPDGLGAKAVVLLGLDAPWKTSDVAAFEISQHAQVQAVLPQTEHRREAPFMCRLTAPDVC